MLAMVASTMLPEAFHKGGQTIVSIMTVLGFIVSFALKAFS
jgi:DNA recombination-dependent growth factor C